jgi:TolB-like protein/DNA-binding winged helix-turn-helix (wHTH) protein/Tfp pilus assembly protein PilF
MYLECSLKVLKVYESLMSERQSYIYEFGDFRVDAARHLLVSRAGDAIPLTPKAFETLLYLVEHHGLVLDKDVLMQAIWPHTVVEENNLNQSISALRRVLGESRGENRYIATVPGRGYQFVADVRKAIAGDSIAESEDVEAISGSGQDIDSRKRSLVFVMVAAIGIVGLCLGLYYFRPTQNTTLSTSPTGPTPIHSKSQGRSIAVLPFKPLVAGLRDESLEMGMADTLIVRLSNLREVPVRPISSVRKFGGLEQDPIAAGSELGVESVLDGQIQRSGDRVRVTVRLISVSDGKQLWADQFDEKFTDIFTLQDLISEKITSALALKLTDEEHSRLTKRYTENVEAYQLYVNGRFYWENRTGEGLKRAIEYFAEAIEKDPNYALAYAGLADSYALLGVFHLPPKEAFPKAREATLNALRIDDHLAEAHAALGHIKVQYEYDWAGAEKEYKRAIELNPNYPNAHHFYALYLAAMGRSDEGIAEIKRAQELEPFSLFIHANVGGILYQARRYDEAISQLKSVLEMNPGFDHARSVLGYAYLQKGMYEQAIAEFEKRTTPATGGYGDLGQAYGSSGKRREALKEVSKLLELSKHRYVAPYNLALIYASLGDKDNALEWLERAYEDRSTLLIWIRVDPRLDSLRSEPRFKAVLNRMGA